MNLTHHPEFDIRYTTLEDAASLHKWLDEPGILRWFPMSNPLEVENAAQVWISFSRVSSSLTATFQTEPCGIGTLFLMPYRKVAHHCLFKIIVAPQFRRQGVATALLRNLKHLAKNYFHLHLMHIEFFEDNPIEHLLRKADFREFARQQRYVKEGERYLARILMECDL